MFLFGNKKKNNISILPEDKCCGCGVCSNICPKNAITMEENQEGFLFPRIDFKKCVDCGLCKNACPALNLKKENFSDPECYALWAQDDVRLISSSGGMFTMLANYVFEQGGVVCGAAFDDDYRVHHITIENPADLDKLRRAKYVQSDTEDIFKQVKAHLNQDKWVLFSGCPCHVAGLRNFLRKPYDKLLTADLVCHGVPSPMVFRKYMEEVHDKDQIENFSFRTKDKGYACTTMKIEMKNGEVLYPSNTNGDIYEKVFHRCMAIRKSCLDCNYAVVPRQGDFTIGDFWGISKFDPKLNDKKGTSVVLVNTQKAKEIFEVIKPQLKMATLVPIEYAKRHNRFGAKEHGFDQRDQFLKEVRKNGVKAAAEKFIK